MSRNGAPGESPGNTHGDFTVAFRAQRYPPLALQARIQGKVDLQVAVEPSTGEVRDVSAILGPLVIPAAIAEFRRVRHPNDRRRRNRHP